MEEWRPAVGYEGLYEVSDQGRVRRLHSPTNRSKNDGVLSPGLAANGYLRVVLCRQNERRNFSVHRLVVEAFKRPFGPGEVTNHIDGDKTNNRPMNLEQVTQKVNDAEARRLGLTTRGKPPILQGSAHHQAQLTDESVREIRALAGRVMQKDLALRFRVSLCTIQSVVQRRTW